MPNADDVVPLSQPLAALGRSLRDYEAVAGGSRGEPEITRARVVEHVGRLHVGGIADQLAVTLPSDAGHNEPG